MTRTHAQLLREIRDLRKRLIAQTKRADLLDIRNTMLERDNIELQREIREMRDCQQNMARRREDVL